MPQLYQTILSRSFTVSDSPRLAAVDLYKGTPQSANSRHCSKHLVSHVEFGLKQPTQKVSLLRRRWELRQLNIALFSYVFFGLSRQLIQTI